MHKVNVAKRTMPILKQLLRNIACAIFVLFLWQSTSSHAASDPLVFSPTGDQKQPLVAQLEYLDDADGTYTIDQVANGRVGQFKPLLRNNFGYGYKQVLWIRFSIDLHHYKDPYWFLTQNYEHVGELTLFYPTKEGFSALELSESEPATKRAFYIHNYLFKVPTPETNPAVYYMRYAPQGHALNVDLSWSSLKGIVENIHNTQLALGLFFGGMAAMWLYNFAICIYLRSRVYAYYIYYLGCFIAMFVYLNGFVPLLLQLNTFYEQLFAAFGYALNSATILFARHFLLLNQSNRWLDIYLRICQWLSIVGGVCAFVLPGNPYQLLNYITLLSVPFLLLAGILRWVQGYAPAKLYTAGWIVLISSIVTYCLRQIGVLPSTWFTVYSIQIGAVLEAILFALALAYRLKLIEQETAVAKNTFLGMVSHELKTPLQTITSSIDLLSMSMTQPKDVEVINRLNSAAEHLEAQMKDLTDYASLESGKMKLRISSFNASTVISQIANEYQLIAKNRGLTFTSNIENCNFNVRSDMFRIQQVVNNLLSNAIKYTDNGQIGIQLYYLEDKPFSLLIKVEDSGIGISAQDIPLIFEPFTQIDQSSTRRHEGVGMGLAIVKRLLTMLNGSIKVNSEPGKGTTIEIRIPVEKMGMSEVGQSSLGEYPPGNRILLVDDNEEVRNSLKSVLEALNYECDVAASGQEAINQIAICKYAAIFLDVYMPDMDGFAVASNVRSTAGTNQQVPIIWISATEPQNITPDQRKLFSNFLQKPVRKSQLEKMLKEILGSNTNSNSV